MAGETVVQVAATKPVFKPLGLTMAGKPVSFEVLSTETETDDIHVVGYLPAGVTFVGAILKTDDLDSGSEALVFTLLVGTTTFDTCTVAQSFAGLLMTGDFITTTAETVLYLKSTTAAATGAAGTVNFMPLYVEAQ